MFINGILRRVMREIDEGDGTGRVVRRGWVGGRKSRGGRCWVLNWKMLEVRSEEEDDDDDEKGEWWGCVG